MFGLEFDGARDRAAKRPGSKSLVKPPSPPCEATGQGGWGAASEKATYWYFPGRRQTPTEAGSGHHALLEGARISLCTGTGGWHTRAGPTAIYRY